MKTRNLKVTTDNLRIGMFVAELDLPWLGMPFPLQGVLIDDPRQVEYLRDRCQEVMIDIHLSKAESIRHLPMLELERDDAGRNLRATVVRHVRTWWESLHAALFGRERAEPEPRARLSGIPPEVKLVTYNDAKPFDEAIAPAREVYREIEIAMQAVMDGLASKHEISVEAIRVVASELVECVAVNHEAMMWLTRMRQQNVRTYMHSVEVAVYMVTFGRHLGFPRDQLENFCVTGLLLDVGMTRIDNALIERNGPLTQPEVSEVR